MTPSSSIGAPSGAQLAQLYFAVDLKLCQFLIESLKSNGDKNPKDFAGTTPLHVAAENGDLKLCELIVENVTDKSPLNNKQETPKDLAYKNGNLYLSEVLSKYALS